MQAAREEQEAKEKAERGEQEAETEAAIRHTPHVAVATVSGSCRT